MSAADARRAETAGPGGDASSPGARERAGPAYGTIVVVGGGCYGSYYVRQLARGARAGALRWERLLVVDRDPSCRVASALRSLVGADPLPAPMPELVTDEWAGFFARWLGEAASAPERAARDAIVPSPLMPHLMYEWLLARARERWPGRRIETRPLPRPPETPWERAAPDGTHFVSFAEWTCPINCIEPARCPATRGPRSWSMPDAARAWVAAERARGGTVGGPLVFHCVHRAYGVGMFDVREVLDADREVAAAGERGAAELLVGTVSHCHGALNLLAVGPPAAAA